MKTYISSDLHIGFEESNYPKIVEFFDIVKNDADKLILIGDIFDLWRCPVETIVGEEPYKTAYEAIVSTAHRVPTRIVFGNHDYNLQRKMNVPYVTVSDDFVDDNIFFCHGWRFDVLQRFGSFAYMWLVDRFPYLYQRFFRSPSRIPRGEYARADLTTKIHDEARRFINKHTFSYLAMGHTHDPVIDGKLIDAGDMIDSLSYVVIEDGVPELRRMRR